tara:strand:- start:7 stop:264 length:258 start_codon:yes stop_codon:yes gene_type:complete
MASSSLVERLAEPMRNHIRGVKRQNRYFAAVLARTRPAVAAEAETRFLGFFGCLAFLDLVFLSAAAFSFLAAAIRSEKLREMQVA